MSGIFNVFFFVLSEGQFYKTWPLGPRCAVLGRARFRCVCGVWTAAICPARNERGIGLPDMPSGPVTIEDRSKQYEHFAWAGGEDTELKPVTKWGALS